MIILKIVLIVACVFVALFMLSLVIYFFNLDMKAASKMLPLMEKIYDRGKAKRDAKSRQEK
ncbi:MAG: hypothetical protein PHC41_10095 [Lachnospiraceae bacterium]|nr:hypothetical protein [Lachnospiraceae bacterium]MDD3616561.1 hypothetical protein [Lachnospiraceae bacterium]